MLDLFTCFYLFELFFDKIMLILLWVCLGAQRLSMVLRKFVLGAGSHLMLVVLNRSSDLVLRPLPDFTELGFGPAEHSPLPENLETLAALEVTQRMLLV